MSSNEKLIVLDDVCKHFKVSGGMLKAVDHISLDIYKGETLGLVGEAAASPRSAVWPWAFIPQRPASSTMPAKS